MFLKKIKLEETGVICLKKVHSQDLLAHYADDIWHEMKVVLNFLFKYTPEQKMDLDFEVELHLMHSTIDLVSAASCSFTDGSDVS